MRSKIAFLKDFYSNLEKKLNIIYTVKANIDSIWGCTGFDIVIGRSWLRVRELFSVINGQLKIDDNNVVSMADFRARKALKAA